MNKYEELFKQYNCTIDDIEVQKEVEKIRAKHLAENNRVDVYKQCLNCIDLTSFCTTIS